MNMLEITDLHATVADKPILRGLNLTIRAGEVHAVMGPNGAGKSTLAQVLAGKPGYEVTGGTVLFDGVELLEMEPEERAHAGLFLGFQYPVEIPGVSNSYLLKAAVNAKRVAQGLPEMDAFEFLQTLKATMGLLEMDPSFKNRFVNVGFSGGEKKRNEILQLVLLNPRLALLDETDSGLDIDALRIVAKGVNSLRDAEHGFLLVTHYQRLLEYIVPDFVHILVEGRIVKSGGPELALELEDKGYVGMGLTRAGG
jgi:Fe-S cluster assembly ATP-binding protein